MIAGDPFQRNFTWPIPDPPKSTWSGAQQSQAALRQKALGFNCLNYAEDPEPSLYRHFLPNKTYLDEHCTDGVRLELMFPSCWNGKDIDSPDHSSHVQYPALVMDGTCPEGYETRLVSLFYETIWNTYAFKDQDGYFALANGDPTGFGYHGDFMFGWDDGVLQEAVDTCTNETGEVGDCEIFTLLSDEQQQQCLLDMPPQLLDDSTFFADGLPGSVPIEWGPGYALPSDLSTPSQLLPSISIPLPTISVGLDLGGGNLFGKQDPANTTEPARAPATTSTSTTFIPRPTPTTSLPADPIVQEVVYIEEDVVVMVNDKGVRYATHTGSARTLSSTTTTASETLTVAPSAEKTGDVPSEPQRRGRILEHARRHAHHHGYLHKRVF